MLYTIDLLKGRGIPAKSKPEGIIATAITVLVPLIIALSMAGLYLSTKILNDLQRSEIARYNRKIEENAANITEYENRCNLKKNFEGCLSETATALGEHEQWSDILVAIVENMPESLVLNKLMVQENRIRVKVPDRNNQGQTIDKMVPSRALSMELEGSSFSQTDEAVKEFRKRLQHSSVLGPNLEDIPVSQEVDENGDSNVVKYELKCIFKPQI